MVIRNHLSVMHYQYKAQISATKWTVDCQRKSILTIHKRTFVGLADSC